MAGATGLHAILAPRDFAEEELSRALGLRARREKLLVAEKVEVLFVEFVRLFVEEGVDMFFRC